MSDTLEKPGPANDEARQPRNRLKLASRSRATASTPSANESVWANGRTARPVFSVTIPTFRDDPSRLIRALARCQSSDATELIVYDDGSGDAILCQRIREAMADYPGPARLVAADRNMGRSHARNRLMVHAGCEWLLMLDADMLPDSRTFIDVYLSAARTCERPALFAGGFSLDRVKPRGSRKLHAAQSLKSECLDAQTRAREPGRHVFTSNLLIHREVLETIGFDPAFVGWGWEDVDWGLRVARHFPVCHLDNTASHLGLDRAGVLMSKYRNSGANFARLVANHPEATKDMALYRAARSLARLGPLALGLGWLSAGSARAGFVPMRLRLGALKLFRAAHYSREFRNG